MTLDACAEIVAKGDPDRFQAVLAAPLVARKVLLPIYAFNVEVARAPWVASEPMISEMRLQWWRDALEEIQKGEQVRRHEVVTPLSEVIDADGAEILDRLISARRWDCYKDAFEDVSHFDSYLQDTGGGLMWVAARALGGTDEAAFRSIGWASGLANLFLAIPELEALGRRPLVDGRNSAVSALARNALRNLQKPPNSGRPATLAAWRAKGILKRAAKYPARVSSGELAESEFQRRIALVMAAWGLG